MALRKPFFGSSPESNRIQLEESASIECRRHADERRKRAADERRAHLHRARTQIWLGCQGAAGWPRSQGAASAVRSAHRRPLVVVVCVCSRGCDGPPNTKRIRANSATNNNGHDDNGLSARPIIILPLVIVNLGHDSPLVSICSRCPTPRKPRAEESSAERRRLSSIGSQLQSDSFAID